MEYIPTFDEAVPVEALLDETTPRWERAKVMRSRPVRKMLRLGSLTMDTLTGVVLWRGELVSLAAEERELLALMLRRAGQILSRERLSALLGASADAVDARMAALIARLEAAGVHARPRRATGLGYVLWR